MNLKQYFKLEQHDQNIVFYDNENNDIITLEDVIQTVNEEKARENFDESTLEDITPIKIQCLDCKHIVLIYADPCEIHEKCDDIAYRCVNCQSSSNDWLVCSLVYGKKAIKLISSDNKKDRENAKDLIKYLDEYWFRSNILN